MDDIVIATTPSKIAGCVLRSVYIQVAEGLGTSGARAPEASRIGAGSALFAQTVARLERCNGLAPRVASAKLCRTCRAHKEEIRSNILEEQLLNAARRALYVGWLHSHTHKQPRSAVGS